MAHTTDGLRVIIPGTRDGMIPGTPGIPGIPGIHHTITAGIVLITTGAGLTLPGTGDILTGIGVVVITTAGMTGHGMAILAATSVPAGLIMTAIRDARSDNVAAWQPTATPVLV